MNKTQRHAELLVDLHNTYKKKNSDYGDAFGISYEKYGFAAGMVRISDKFHRIDNLALNGNQKVNDESMIDSLMDLANYCIMTVMELENEE